MSFTFPDSLATWAREDGGKPAIIEGDRSVTYLELDQHSDLVAQRLAAEGVGAGHRVAYVGRNRIEFFELLYGAAKTGAVVVPLNWRLTAAEVQTLVRDAEARLVVVDDEFIHLVPSGLERVRTGSEYQAWRDAADGRPGPARAGHADDAVVQSYTSGTTGLPKGVLLTNRMYESYIRICATYGLGRHSVIGLPQPVFHVGGNATFSMALTHGGTVVLFERFDVDYVLDLIERHRITFMTLAPVMMSMLAAAQRERPRDLTSWDAVMYGGQAITEAAIEGIRSALSTRLFQAFGMTECCGAMTHLDPDEHTGTLRLSAGRAFPWNEMAIFDPETFEPCLPGTVGELCFRSAQCTPGYWHRPESTQALYGQGGWLRTGDAGYIDEAGYLFLTDRMNDKIVTGGENVYPREVESVLVQHSAIADVVVVGGPHEKWGETVVAVVVKTQGAELSADELIDWSRGRLAGFRRPRQVLFVEELPKSAEGKVLRRELRKSLWGADARTIG